MPARNIPWEFVNLIETDPARRVRLKISSDRIARLHPADIADIIEELAPAERDAVFQALDEDVAAQALEEIDPKLQVSLLNNMESDRAADIVEEMDPDAAADLLGELTDEHSEAILDEMEPQERQDVEELLEFEEDTAAGRMTTDYMALAPTARVHDAVEMLKHFDGGLESLSTIFLIGENEKLLGAVPLAKLIVSHPEHASVGTDHRAAHYLLARGRRARGRRDLRQIRSPHPSGSRWRRNLNRRNHRR